ncbi:MAG: hypothetical protein ACO3BC_02885, partial [Ilumatobacteraceae bacterium]
MPQIKFGDRVVGQSDLPYVIAEIGVNHEGSLETAKQLIDLANQVGEMQKLDSISGRKIGKQKISAA